MDVRLQVKVDGVTQDVNTDTGTPANSVPVPVSLVSGGLGALTVDQGNPNATLSEAWPIKVTDGTHTASVSASSALKVDGSAVTQPVSGTVTANAGTGTFAVSAAALPLPSGAATSAKQPALGTAGTASSDVITVQGIASMTALKVDGSAVTQPVSGTVTANAGTGTFAVSASALPLPTGAATETTLSTLNGKVPALGQAAMASSTPVAIASNQSAIPSSQSGTWTVQPGNTANTTAWLVNETTSGTATVTSVASSASSVSLLASNANRKNAMFFNDSTSVLYLKLGTTASTSSYTVQILSGGYYEIPNGKIYTGAIDGIWSSANGNVRITELT